MGIEIKFYNLETFKKQVDNCIDLDSEFVDLNYKFSSLIFCHFWRSIFARARLLRHALLIPLLILRKTRLSPVSLSVFSLVPDLLLDCSRILEYAKIQTVCSLNFAPHCGHWNFTMQRTGS